MTLRGVPVPTEEELDDPIRAALGWLPRDVGSAWSWISRGPVASCPLFPLFLRRFLLRRGGVKIGRKVLGMRSCYLESPNVHVRDGAGINYGFVVEGSGRVDVGRGVMVGPQVMILTSVHAISDDGVVSKAPDYDSVLIGDGCWIGARAVILPGVTVGAGTTVAAGAVVVRDCEPGALYAGVPAKRIK